MTELTLCPRLVLTEAHLGQVVEDLLAAKEFVVDVETVGGLQPTLNEVLWLGFSGEFGVHLIPIGHPNGDLITPAQSVDVPDMDTVRPYKNNPERFTKPKMRKVFQEATFTAPPKQLRPDVVFAALECIFFDPTKICIGHNLKYDLKSIAKYYGHRMPTCVRADTVIAQHLVDENLMSYKLKDLIPAWILGPAAKNPETKAAFYPNLGQNIAGETLMDIARYLAKDVTYTWWLYKRLMRLMEKEDLLDAFDLEMDLHPVLSQMEYYGMYVDQVVAKELQDMLSTEIKKIEVEAWSICGEQFPLTNPNKKKEFIFKPKKEGGQGLKPLSWTKPTKVNPSGSPQLNKPFYERYADENRLVWLFQEQSKMEKLKSSFVDKFLDGETLLEGRVHTQFHQHRTATGRLSSSEPNLQQIPTRGDLGKEFRKAFVAQPGFVLVVLDYDQIELRGIANQSGDPEMRRLFISGEDIHRGAAAGAFDVPFEEVTDVMRDAGKVVNFLVGYGGGAKRLKQVIKRPEAECEEIIERYYERFSYIEPWKTKLIARAVKTGSRRDPERFPPYIEIPPFGRRRRVPDLFSEDKYEVFRAQRQLVNAVVQGLAAYVMKLGLIDLNNGLQKAGFEARIVLTVHDEVIIQAPQDEAQEVYDLTVKMLQGVTIGGEPAFGDVPLVASGGIGQTWVEAKAA